MANGKCEKCGKKLENICQTKNDVLLLLNLLENRIHRIFLTNIAYKITPGIRHNEIIWSSECDGVLYYNHFDEEPKILKKINIGDIMLGLLSIEDAKKLLL
jgi:hypothetical protein